MRQWGLVLVISQVVAEMVQGSSFLYADLFYVLWCACKWTQNKRVTAYFHTLFTSCEQKENRSNFCQFCPVLNFNKCWSIFVARMYVLPKIAENKSSFDNWDPKSEKLTLCLEDLNVLELSCNQRVEPQFLKYCHTNEFLLLL